MPLGAQIGFGPVYYQHEPNKIKKCDERLLDSCQTEHRCCVVVACKYCLEWQEYGQEEIQEGVAKVNRFGTMLGEVAAMVVEAKLERDEYNGRCQLRVKLDGQVVAIFPLCDGVISCRDYSNEATVTLVDEYGNPVTSGVLRWMKYEGRPLRYRKTENGCTKHYCGTCECTCRKLCVSVERPGEPVCKKDINEVAYSDCDAPEWVGTVPCFERPVDVRIQLKRDDETGGCLVGGTADGEDLEFLEVTDCRRLSASWILYDGTILSIVCKECTCKSTFTIPCCGEIPITAESLNARLIGIEAFGPEGQFSNCTWEGALPLILVAGPYFRTWGGIIPLTVNGGCFNCCNNIVFFLHVTCDGTSEHQLCVAFWFASTVAGYTLTPLDTGHTGWTPGTGNAPPAATSYCAGLAEFAPTTATVFASCRPLMMFHADSGIAQILISELALP